MVDPAIKIVSVLAVFVLSVNYLNWRFGSKQTATIGSILPFKIVLAKPTPRSSSDLGRKLINCYLAVLVIGTLFVSVPKMLQAEVAMNTLFIPLLFAFVMICLEGNGCDMSIHKNNKNQASNS